VTLDAAPALLALLRDRRSIRSFDDAHELSDDDLRVLLEAARWAPSAGNSQPWAFLVARRGDAAHEAFVPLLSRGNLSWAPRASALVFTLHQVATGPESDAFVYSDYAAYDLGQAVAQLSVQALALDLVVHQFAGFDHEAMAEVAQVPRHWQVTTGVALGRPLPSREGGDPHARERDERPRTRKPLAEVAYGATFGEGLELR
jgi:nitroreductase